MTLSEAMEIILKYNSASVSLIQRRMKLGYYNACLIMERLEQVGAVGKPNGAKPRKILVDNMEQFDKIKHRQHDDAINSNTVKSELNELD